MRWPMGDLWRPAYHAVSDLALPGKLTAPPTVAAAELLLPWLPRRGIAVRGHQRVRERGRERGRLSRISTPSRAGSTSSVLPAFWATVRAIPAMVSIMSSL